MGRVKKGRNVVRTDLWEKAGGIDAVVKELEKADILSRNTESSSEIWSELARVLFNEDIQKNRIWLWVAWRENRKCLRDRVRLATEHGNVKIQEVPENGTERMKPEDQGNIIILKHLLK